MSSTLRLLAFTALTATALVALGGQPPELEPPFPDARITVEQLDAYRAKIEGTSSIECEDTWAHHRKCVEESTFTIWNFTQNGHAAHPAFSRAVMITPPLSIGIARSSHFAGDEVAFRAWVAEFRVLDQRQIEEFKRMFAQ